MAATNDTAVFMICAISVLFVYVGRSYLMTWLLGVTILMMFKSNSPPVCQSILLTLVFVCSCSSKAGPSVTSKLPFSVSSLALQVCVCVCVKCRALVL